MIGAVIAALQKLISFRIARLIRRVENTAGTSGIEFAGDLFPDTIGDKVVMIFNDLPQKGRAYRVDEV